jgi:hypothetical protein
MKLDLYLTFVHEDPQDVRPGDIRQFAQLSFGGRSLTDKERDAVVSQFTALTACEQVQCHAKSGKALVGAVTTDQPDEAKFVEQVTDCARKHYNVKRVTHSGAQS